MPAALSFTSWNWCFLWDFIQDCYQESFWDSIAHLAELKIAQMSVFPWCPERVAYDRVVLTTGRASGIWGGLANRAIVVGFWWFWQFWKALEKVDEECHGFRALAITSIALTAFIISEMWLTWKFDDWRCKNLAVISWNLFLPTLESGINVGVRLFIFEKFWRKKNNIDCNALIDVRIN